MASIHGSALPWIDAIRSAGRARLAGGRGGGLRPPAPLSVGDGDSWVVALPAPATRLTYGIDFPHAAPIGRQWFSWLPGAAADESFAREVAPARTFAPSSRSDAASASPSARWRRACRIASSWSAGRSCSDASCSSSATCSACCSSRRRTPAAAVTNVVGVRRRALGQ